MKHLEEERFEIIQLGKGEGRDVLDYYRARFQIEFCHRDSKQFTGLTDCQSRDLNKLHFHFNASLTSVNLAKGESIGERNRSINGVCKGAVPQSFSYATIYFRVRD